MKTITFEVPGNPVPQPRARISTRGGFGRAYVPERHPVHAYRSSIAVAAEKAGATPTAHEPITVIIDLVFSRPASHLTKKGLRKGAPVLPRVDVDNCIKAALDSLNGVAWVDDKQVGKVIAEKTYGTEGRTTIRIS